MADEWVPVRRRKNWRHAPPGTPLWERLPRDLQEHIARFLKQKILWRLCKLGMPGDSRFLTEEDHLMQIENLMQVAPIFDNALYTVYLLSVTVHRWHHHHAFANGLVRFAWEAFDARLATAQGASHISVPWKRQNDKLRLDVGRFQHCVLCRLKWIAKRAYEMCGSHYLPEHYLVEVCAAIDQGVHKGTLRWIHGYNRQLVAHFLQAIVNTSWYGRTKKQENEVKARIKATMRDALQNAPQA